MKIKGYSLFNTLTWNVIDERKPASLAFFENDFYILIT